MSALPNTPECAFAELAIGQGFAYDGRVWRKVSNSTAMRCGIVPRVEHFNGHIRVEPASMPRRPFGK